MSSNTSAETQSQQTKCSIDCDCTVHCKLHPNDNNPQPSAETPEEGTKKREPGYYWVRVEESVYPRDWFIVYWGNNHWKVDGRFDWQDGRFSEIDERRIERGQASLERENAELKERLSTMYDGFSKSVLAVKDQQETIKRYKKSLELIQVMALLKPSDERSCEIWTEAKSALSGTKGCEYCNGSGYDPYPNHDTTIRPCPKCK